LSCRYAPAVLDFLWPKIVIFQCVFKLNHQFLVLCPAEYSFLISILTGVSFTILMTSSRTSPILYFRKNKTSSVQKTYREPACQNQRTQILYSDKQPWTALPTGLYRFFLCNSHDMLSFHGCYNKRSAASRQHPF